MRTGSLRSWAVAGGVALLAVLPARAQEVMQLPSAPRPAPLVTPGGPAGAPAGPAGGLLTASPGPQGGAPSGAPQHVQPAVQGGVLPAPGPGVPPAPLHGIEPLPQAAPHAAVGPVPDGPPAVAPDGHEGSSWGGAFFTADYLLLKPRRNDMDYAIVSPNITQTPGGTVTSVNWNTDSGYRLGVGYVLPGTDWALGGTYTYFHSHGDDSVAAPTGGTLFATLTRGGSFDQVGTAAANNSFDYNIFDLDLSHRIKVCDRFAVTVFGGGRFAWIDQGLTAVYNGGPDHAVNDVVHSPVDFHGAGLTMGAEGQWNFWRGLGLYARTRACLLSGDFRNTLTETANNGSVTIVNVVERTQQIVPELEMGFGLCYCGEHWEFSVGYEIANWFSMVNSVDFPSGSNIGLTGRRVSDLSLEGLAVQLGVRF